MAVRDALLVLLSMGPAYGFALHGGLTERTGGRRSVNVGQTYATLDRLTKQGLVEPDGTTDDGLPLHRLTPAGRAASSAWLHGADASGADPWDETVDRVLIAASLPGFDAASVIDAELARWRERRGDAAHRAEPDGRAAREVDGDVGSGHPLVALAAAAEAARASAAVDWLESARERTIGSARDGRPALAFAPRAERPRRGRRPGPASSGAAPGEPALQGATAP
ncbi:DNA-binding PadR family transcriptional regulator [Agromyces terreus]|uniref:DNA-binding PadR family transcriptional regulator n=1 Tax=Agromyces terreus TaxID=424795 RepID=A0A9X2H057_9MICO|nr:helix-turn-helix transcriptional regulator [Agromyces terreus]MCP2371872.1 DNA-binding PadR family transcriptional regulator [Agromyces terreus]